MSDLQIAMRAAKIDRLRASRRFGAFAVLTLRAIEKIRAGRMTASEAARHAGAAHQRDVTLKMPCWRGHRCVLRPIPYSGAHSSGGLMGGARGCLRHGIWRVIPRRHL